MLSATLSTAGAHDFLQLLMDLRGIALQGFPRQMARDLFDHTQDFFLPCRGSRVIDPLVALLTGKDIDHQMRRTHQSFLPGRRRLDLEQFGHQRFVQTAAKVRQHLGEYEMALMPIRVDPLQTAGIYHREVGAQAAADLLIGAGQLRFEDLQSQQHLGRDRRSTQVCFLGKVGSEVAIHRCGHRFPGKGIGATGASNGHRAQRR